MRSERAKAIRKAHAMISQDRTLSAARFLQHNLHALPVTRVLEAANDELWFVDEGNFSVRLQEIRNDLNRLLDDMAAY